MPEEEYVDMRNNEGYSEIKWWKVTYSKIHCQPPNSSTFSGSQLRDTRVLPAPIWWQHFTAIQKNKNPSHLPCLWINARPCSIWNMMFLIADSGNNLVLYRAKGKSYKSRFTNENGIHFCSIVRTCENIGSRANLTRFFDNTEQRKTTICPYTPNIVNYVTKKQWWNIL